MSRAWPVLWLLALAPRLASAGSLRADLALAAPGATLTLPAGVLTGPDYCNLTVATPRLLLQGQDGTVIDCANSSRHLTIAAANISISGVAFVNGRPADGAGGGCVLATADGLRLSRVQFTACVASEGNGGALLALGGALSLSESVTFANNQAPAGSGGGLWSAFPPVDGLLPSTFLSNYAGGDGGGAFVGAGDVTITGLLQANIAASGGALSVSGGSLRLQGNARCENNTVGFRGGCFYSSGGTFVITDSARMRFNRAVVYGGGGALISGKGFTVDGDAVLESNKAPSGGGVYADTGGAVVIGGRALILRNNATAARGGGFYISGTRPSIAVKGDVHFIENNASQGAGFFAYIVGNVLVTDRVIFVKNFARGALSNDGKSGLIGVGGGLWTERFTFLLVSGDVIFSDNFASGLGSGIAARYGSVNVTGNVQMLKNFARSRVGDTSLQGGGAGLYLGDPLFSGQYEAFVDQNVLFQDNKAVSSTAIAAYGVSLTISGNVTFRQNIAERGTSAVNVESGLLRIQDNVLFEANYGTRCLYFSSFRFSRHIFEINSKNVIFRHNINTDGNLIYFYSAYSEKTNGISGGLFENNTAAGLFGSKFSAGSLCGGVLLLMGGHFTINGNAKFVRNQAEYGGAIHIQDTVLHIEGSNVLFLENTASQTGGAINIANGATLFVSRGVVFSKNTAVLGGAIAHYARYGSSDVHVKDVFFDSNSAATGGAVGISYGGVITCNGSIFRNNSATENGGAASVVSDGSSIMIIDAVFEYNYVTNDGQCTGQYACGGGALALTQNSNMTISGNTLFLGNRAKTAGGAVLLSGTSILLLDYTSSVTMSHNLAGEDGGGIAMIESSSLHLDGAELTLASCRALGKGGAFFLNGVQTLATNGSQIFFFNNSAHDGGGLFSYSVFRIMSGASCTFTQNFALAFGGGAVVYGSNALLALEGKTSRIFFIQNIANEGGGGLALQESGSIIASTETCPTTCVGQYDNECQSRCLSRECNWDNNGCMPTFANARNFSRADCKDLGCDTTNIQYDLSGLGCDDSCFSAACMWQGPWCVAVKDRIKTCPVFDLATFISINGHAMDRGVHYTVGGKLGRWAICLNSQSANDDKPEVCTGAPSWQNVFSATPLWDGKKWLAVQATNDLATEIHKVTFEIRFKMSESTIPMTLMATASVNIVMIDTHTFIITWINDTVINSICTQTYSTPGLLSYWTDMAVVGNSVQAPPGSWRVFLNGSLISPIYSGPNCYSTLQNLPFIRQGSNYYQYEIFGAYMHIGRQLAPSDDAKTFIGDIERILIWTDAVWHRGFLSTQCRLIPSDMLPAACYDLHDAITYVQDRGKYISAMYDAHAYILYSPTEMCDVFSYAKNPLLAQNPNLRGYCTVNQKPMLPTYAFDYEPRDIDAFIKSTRRTVRSTLDAVEQWPDCAIVPVVFKGNVAVRGHGGAIHQTGCDNAKAAQGQCFFGAFHNMAGGTNIVAFVDNVAGGGGGAVYTSCMQPLVDACVDALAQTVGFGEELRLVLDRPGLPIGRLYFAGNRAGAYGDDVATGASELAVTKVWPEYVPGQQPLNASIVLLDGLGQVIRGSAAVPLSLVVVTELCQGAAAACALTSGLLPAAFHPLDDTTGVAVTYPAQEVRCPSGAASVTARASLLLGADQLTDLLTKTVVVSCLKCGAGEQFTVENGAYYCKTCGEKKYIVDPNGGTCQDCPIGATCDGGGGVQGKDGSVWEVVGERYRLVRCMDGYVLVRVEANPLDDQCVKCPGTPYPGFYALGGGDWANQTLVSASAGEAATSLCRSCPQGATCELGGNSTLALPGYWVLAPGSRNARRAAGGGETVEVYRCLNSEVCLGENQCKNGATGYVCAICEPNYTLAGLTCVYCDPADSLQTPRALLALFIVVGGLAVWWFVSARPFIAVIWPSTSTSTSANAQPAQGEGGTAERDATATIVSVAGLSQPSAEASEAPGEPGPAEVGSGESRRKSSLIGEWLSSKITTFKAKKREIDSVLGTTKILISFYQVTSCFLTSFNVPWPSSLSTLFAYASVLRAELLSIPSLACLAANWNHEARLLCYTLIPAGLVLWLGLPLAFARHVLGHTRESSPAFATMEAKFYSTALFCLFLVYPLCSIAVFDTFNCRWIDGKHLLARDLRMVCPTSADSPSRWLAPYAAICVMLFPVGIPWVMLWALHHFDVPRMAREKRRRAFRQAIVAAYRAEHVQALLKFEGVTSALLDAASLVKSGLRNAFVRDVQEAMRQTQAWGLAAEEDHQAAAQHVFDRFDSNGDGVLSSQEAAAMRLALGGSVLTADGLDDTDRYILLTYRWARRQGLPKLGVRPTDKALLGLCDELQHEGVLPAADTTVYWDESVPEEAVAIRCVGFLFMSYSVDAWYFDLVEQLRKLLMTSVIVFLMSQPPAQLAVGILITFFALLLNVRRVPFVIRPLNTLQAACLTAQVVTLFYGLLILTDKLVNDAATFGFFLINALMPAAALVNVLARPAWQASARCCSAAAERVQAAERGPSAG